MKLFLYCCTAIFFLSGCIHNSDAGESNNVEFTVVSEGNQSGISSQQMRVVNTSEQLSDLLSMLTISGDIPNPDFTTRSLVTIFLGSNSGCGDELSTTNVEDNGITIIVNVTMRVPGSGTVCPAIFRPGTPYVFVGINKTSRPISLIVDVEEFG